MLFSAFSGSVRVFYSITAGHISDLNDELHPAIAGQDFVAVDGYVDLSDGQSSANLALNISDDTLPEVQEVFLVNLTGESVRDLRLTLVSLILV